MMDFFLSGLMNNLTLAIEYEVGDNNFGCSEASGLTSWFSSYAPKQMRCYSYTSIANIWFHYSLPHPLDDHSKDTVIGSFSPQLC